jgi:hypothetical protein
MHGERKQIGIRDLPVMEQPISHIDASDIPRQSIRPKHMSRMGKQFLE